MDLESNGEILRIGDLTKETISCLTCPWGNMIDMYK